MSKKAITYFNHTPYMVVVKTEKERLINVKPLTGIHCLDYNGELFTHVKYKEVDDKFYKI